MSAKIVSKRLKVEVPRERLKVEAPSKTDVVAKIREKHVTIFTEFLQERWKRIEYHHDCLESWLSSLIYGRLKPALRLVESISRLSESRSSPHGCLKFRISLVNV